MNPFFILTPSREERKENRISYIKEMKFENERWLFNGRGELIERYFRDFTLSSGKRKKDPCDPVDPVRNAFVGFFVLFAFIALIALVVLIVVITFAVRRVPHAFHSNPRILEPLNPLEVIYLKLQTSNCF